MEDDSPEKETFKVAMNGFPGYNLLSEAELDMEFLETVLDLLRHMSGAEMLVRFGSLLQKFRN